MLSTRITTYVFIIALLLVLPGCFKRYNFTKLETLTEKTAQVKQEKNGITLFAKKWSSEEAEEFFAGRNPLTGKQPLQPIQLTIINTGRTAIILKNNAFTQNIVTQKDIITYIGYYPTELYAISSIVCAAACVPLTIIYGGILIFAYGTSPVGILGTLYFMSLGTIPLTSLVLCQQNASVAHRARHNNKVLDHVLSQILSETSTIAPQGFLNTLILVDKNELDNKALDLVIHDENLSPVTEFKNITNLCHIN